MNSTLELVKPLTIWKLKFGKIVMVINKSTVHDDIVFVINQETNKEDVEYLSSFHEATLIG